MACCRQNTTTADIDSNLGALFIRISSNLWWAFRIRARSQAVSVRNKVPGLFFGNP